MSVTSLYLLFDGKKYGEWGRNSWTYERFHGCIDVTFGDTNNAPNAPSVPFPPTIATPAPLTTPPVPAPTPTPPVNPNCVISIRDGRNPWYAGMDIGFDNVSSVMLDFTNTGLNLSQVTIDAGNFQVSVDGPRMTVTKPSWVTSTTFGYLGFNGNNVASLTTFTQPLCYNSDNGGGGAARRNLRSI